MRGALQPHRLSKALSAAAILALITPSHAQQQLTLADTEDHLSTTNSASLLSAADAFAKTDFPRADQLYRQAWNNPNYRHQAAMSLWNLYRGKGIKLETDKNAINTALSQLGPGFVRNDTSHFVILSNCDARFTQSRGELLERTRSQFYRVADRLGLDALPHKSKLICILIADRNAYLSFARSRDNLKSDWIAGYYSTKTNRIVFYNDNSNPDLAAAKDNIAKARAQVADARARAAKAEQDNNPGLAQRLTAAADDLESRIKAEDSRITTITTDTTTAKTIHEAIHLLAFNSGAQLPSREYPFWLCEGLATSFETDDPKSAFGPDRSVSRERLSRFKELQKAGHMRPLSDLVTMMDANGCDAQTAEAIYCQSTALFTYLYKSNPQALGRYIRAITDSNPGKLGEARQLSLFTSSFGDTGALEPRLGTR